MTFEHDPLPTNALSRRALLRNAVGASALLSLPLLMESLAQAAMAEPLPQTAQRGRAGNLYAPFRMGLQSYSLRHFNTDEMLAKTKELGLRFLEAYPAHFPMTEDAAVIAGYKEKLKAAGVRLLAYGVVDFSTDEADARKKLAFGKAMGVEILTAYPKPDALPLLDKLVDEYGLNIAIHNHGPGDDLYDTQDKMLKALQGRNMRIGACCDTGHYLRSGINPAQVAREVGDRLFDVHLKNVKEGPNGTKEFTEIGVPGGLLDTVLLFRRLIEDKYRGPVMLEYEEHEDNPMSQIKECLDAVQRAAKTAR